MYRPSATRFEDSCSVGARLINHHSSLLRIHTKQRNLDECKTPRSATLGLLLKQCRPCGLNGVCVHARTVSQWRNTFDCSFSFSITCRGATNVVYFNLNFGAVIIATLSVLQKRFSHNDDLCNFKENELHIQLTNVFKLVYGIRRFLSNIGRNEN